MTVTLSKQDNIIKLEGVITLENVTALFCDICNQFSTNVSLDLAGVSNVNSACVSLLVEVKKYCQQQSFNIGFVNLSDDMKSTIEVCGVADFLIESEC